MGVHLRPMTIESVLPSKQHWHQVAATGTIVSAATEPTQQARAPIELVVHPDPPTGWATAQAAYSPIDAATGHVLHRLIRRFGAAWVTTWFAAVTVGCSTGMTAALDLLLKGFVPQADLLIATVVPGLLAPLMIFGFAELSERLDLAEQELLTLATEDPLTRVFNRGHFLKLAAREADRARRYGRPLTLLMLDIDNFKSINDTDGHAAGDAVLLALGEVCRANLRRVDLLGRYGGDEFLVLLPEMDNCGGRIVAERLWNAIKNAEVDAGRRLLRFTVSIGVASAGPAAADIDQLLGSVDAALYNAKRHGRNRVEYN